MSNRKKNMKKQNLFCRFVWFNGELIAVFMRTCADRRYDGRQWLRGCYQHVGQHGECYDGMKDRKRATPAEYSELKNELERHFDYKVIVV